MHIVFTSLLIFIFTSCASSESGKKEADFPVLPALTVITADNFPVISMRKQYTAGHWVSIPSDNQMTVIGISNPMKKREDEIAAAKEDAARKVAMYYGIEGSIESIHRSDGSFFNSVNDSRIKLLYDPNYKKYIDELTFDPQHDVLLTDEGLFIRFQHKTNVKSINHIITNTTEGRPAWTRNQNKPVFDGFVSAVGFAQNQRRLKETIFKAAEAAAARMLEDLSISIINKEVTGTEYGSSSLIYSKSEGTLSSFQVIEFWIDPETGYVYTLAIAKRP
jgi:hypothetical protein